MCELILLTLPDQLDVLFAVGDTLPPLLLLSEGQVQQGRALQGTLADSLVSQPHCHSCTSVLGQEV